MKALLLLFLIIPFSLAAQQAKDNFRVNNPEYKTIYYGYPNLIKYGGCQDCDTVILKLKGGSFEWKKSGQGYLKPDSKSKVTTIQFRCVQGSDTSLITAIAYHNKPLPDPDIFLGGAMISDPLLDEYSDAQTIFQLVFHAKYMDQMIRSAHFRVEGWMVKIHKRKFYGDSKNISQELREAIIESEKGDVIEFKYVDVTFPDGETKRVHLNRIYTKKTEYGTKPDIKPQSTITPKSE